MKLWTLYVAALINFASYRTVSAHIAGLEHDYKWDILIFTQHWPTTVCIQWKEHVKTHSCLLSQNWAVHGVWPTKLGTIGPGFCNNSWHFDPQALTSIQTKLDQYWPNIENGTEEDSLWKHEWQKHGTCAAQLRPLNTELKYFSQGLKWYLQRNITQALEKARILPDDVKQYNVKDIWMAVKTSIGTNPGVECINYKHVTYLAEIRICYDKELRLIDCDGIKGQSNDLTIITDCPLDTGIIYPQTAPSSDMEPLSYNFSLTWVDVVYWLQWLTWLTF